MDIFPCLYCPVPIQGWNQDTILFRNGEPIACICKTCMGKREKEAMILRIKAARNGKQP